MVRIRRRWRTQCKPRVLKDPAAAYLELFGESVEVTRLDSHFGTTHEDYEIKEYVSAAGRFAPHALATLGPAADRFLA
jgi:hypothetical protein